MKKKLIAVDVQDLVPHSSRKSFNGKAKVITVGDTRFLLSYETIMGSIDGDGNWHRYSCFRSNTTDCHIKSFFGDGAKFRALPLEEKPEILVKL